MKESREDNIKVKLDTLIQQGIVIKQSLDRFNQYLVLNNEIMRQLDETIKIHLAAINKIGENSEEFSKTMKELLKKK